MKEFIQLTYSFCFLACLLDGGHIIYRTANNLFFMLMKYKCKRSDADEILSRAVEKIKEINRAERDYLNCLIHELSAI